MVDLALTCSKQYHSTFCRDQGCDQGDPDGKTSMATRFAGNSEKSGEIAFGNLMPEGQMKNDMSVGLG